MDPVSDGEHSSRQVAITRQLGTLRTQAPLACKTMHADYSPICLMRGLSSYSPVAALDMSLSSAGTRDSRMLDTCHTQSSYDVCPSPYGPTGFDSISRSNTGPQQTSSLHATSSIGRNPFNDIPHQIRALRPCHDQFEDESTGDQADELRQQYLLRYNDVSSERMYSPIAAMCEKRQSPFSSCRPGPQHTSATHEDADGAVCSKPIRTSVSITIQAADSSINVVIRDGMSVLNLKEKLWQLSGVPPAQQSLLLATGAFLPDDLQLAKSGLTHGSTVLMHTNA